MKIMKLFIIIVSVIVLLVWGVNSFSKGVPVQSAVARKGKIFEYIEERAKTSLPHTYHITMPLQGRIMPIKFKAGNLVKKDDIIVELEQDDFKTRIKALEAKIKAIKAQIKVNEYNAIEKTALKESYDWIAAMEKLVKSTHKKIEANQWILKYSKDYQKALKESSITVSDIEKSAARKETAVAQVELEKSQIDYNAIQIIEKIFCLLPNYINEFLTRKTLKKEVLKSQLIEAQILLKKAKRDLKRTTIKSPINGIVLHRYVSNKRILGAGMPLLDIGNLDDLEVSADILTQVAINIQKGNPVDIYGAAIAPKPLKGKVIRINPKGFTKLSSLGVEQQRVRVVISIDKKDMANLKKQSKQLGDGYRVHVKIYTASAQKATIVPRTSLFKGEKNNWKIFVIKENKAVLTDVTAGLINDNDVQILKGLKPGDRIILAPPVSLIDGSKVSFK